MFEKLFEESIVEWTNKAEGKYLHSECPFCKAVNNIHGGDGLYCTFTSEIPCPMAGTGLCNNLYVRYCAAVKGNQTKKKTFYAWAIVGGLKGLFNACMAREGWYHYEHKNARVAVRFGGPDGDI